MSSEATGLETLHIGGKFVGHDAAIFVAIPSRQRIFGISNERLTRYKHDDLYPIPAIYSFLAYERIDPGAVKKVCYANSFQSQANEPYKPNRYELTVLQRLHYGARYLGEFHEAEKKLSGLKGEQLLQNFMATEYGRQFIAETQRLAQAGKDVEPLDQSIKDYLRKIFPNAAVEVSYFDHQLCHAASSLLSTPFEQTLLLTFDGYGDGHFSRAYLADHGKLTEIASSSFETFDLQTTGQNYAEGMGSPGGIYHYFTFLLGFQPDADEGKVEALAAFAEPDPNLLRDLLEIFTIDRANNSLCFNKSKAEAALNFPRMQSIMKTVSREQIAAAVQCFLDSVMVEYTGFLMQRSGAKSLSLSGGVAANVVSNLRIFEAVTSNLHIIPAMGDDGTAQGAAILQLLQSGYTYEDLRWMKQQQMPYFGTSHARTEIVGRIARFSDKITISDLGEAWPEHAAELVASGQVGAIFHGRMEWGPRALGNRSIIADTRRADMRERINKEIKRRPLFQPFCPSMLAEEKDRLFERSYLNKHMTCAFRMKPEFVKDLPSAVHVDNTARVQFVEESDNPEYHRLLSRMKELTGYGVVINTSFNRHGRTIVESPEDAVTDFLDTDLSFLIIEGFLIRRI